MTLTDEQLAEIRTRLEAATPGPWVRGQNGPIWNSRVYGPANHGAESGPLCDTLGIQNPERRTANRDFIAHAPTDIRALLTEIERLRAEGLRLTGIYCGSGGSLGTTREFQRLFGVLEVELESTP